MHFFILPLFVWTPYVRDKGLGAALSSDHSAIALTTTTVMVGLLSVVLLREHTLMVLALAAAIFVGARHMMMQRIGGTTGDTAGALIEVLEAFILAAAVFR